MVNVHKQIAGYGAILTAKVVHSVVAKVFLVQEFSHVSDGVSVQSLAPTRWKRHGNDPIRHVSEVQVKMIVDVASLILRNLKQEICVHRGSSFTWYIQ